MAVTLVEDWSAYAENTEVQNITGWTASAVFPADAASAKVNATADVKSTTSNGGLLYYDAGAASNYIDFTYPFPASAGVITSGPAIRCIDYLNFIGARLWVDGLEVYHRTGSTTYNRLLFISSVNVLTNDVIRLSLNGDTLQVFKNTIQIGTDIDVTGIHSGSNVGFWTAGAVGDPAVGDLEIGTLVSDAISITSVIDREINSIQGATFAKTIGGTYSGVTTPTSIEYKVTEFVSGTLVSDWVVLDATPSAGSFSGVVNLPVGPYYKVEVRFSNLTTVNNASGRLGVGYLFEFAGQSNTDALFGTGSDATPLDDTAIFDGSTTWSKPTAEQVGHFLNVVSTALGCVIGCYNTAVGGTGIANHLPAGTNYAARSAALTAAGGKINGMYWGQGEADTAPTATYETDLGTLYTDILTRASQTSITLPMFIVQLGRNDAQVGNDVGWQFIRSAQTNYATATANVYISHQTLDLPMVDQFHRTASGYKQEALRSADTVSSVLLGSGTTGRGVLVTSATISSNLIDITHSFNGSTLITLPLNAKDGYEVSNDEFSTLLTINNIAVTSNVITLTLASSPTGTIKVRSQQGQDPDETKFPVGDKTYDAQAVMVEPIVNSITATALTSTLNITVTGIPDGSYMTVLDDDTGVRIQRQNETYTSAVLNIILPVTAGTTVKGYVDDNLNPSSNGAYLEGITS